MHVPWGGGGGLHQTPAQCSARRSRKQSEYCRVQLITTPVFVCTLLLTTNYLFQHIFIMSCLLISFPVQAGVQCPDTLSLHSSLNVRDHVSQPYSTTGNIIVLYVLIFKFLERSTCNIPLTYTVHLNSDIMQPGWKKVGELLIF